LSVSCSKSNPFFAAQHTDYKFAPAGALKERNILAQGNALRL
jgi:hypothetical protein